MEGAGQVARDVSFADGARTWARVALLSFGGPAGQIATMHRILVDEKRWIGEDRFLHALSYCMLLPGPEAQQLATYIGWLLHGARGGLLAGTLFVLPGFLAIGAFSILYVSYSETQLAQTILFGLKPAVVAIVAEAVARIGKRALKTDASVTLAILAFVALFLFEVPFPLVILAAALLGLVGARVWPGRFRVKIAAGTAAADLEKAVSPVPLSRTLMVAALGLTLWWTPTLILAGIFGSGHILPQMGIFFSEAAVVTFGGAYSVLAFVAQQAVETHGWLRPGEMLDGLGMAETTPGPLIQVVQFVGFLGAYRHPEPFSPLAAACLASLLVTWVTYVPSLLWIFLGAPYIEGLRRSESLAAALAAITAAVVGVILNLAVWFALHTLFGVVREVHSWGARWQVPVLSTLDAGALVIALFAMASIFWWKQGMARTLVGGVLLGAAIRWAF